MTTQLASDKSFPPFEFETATIFSDKQKQELADDVDYPWSEDCMGTTIFGEAINRHAYCGDDYYIYDPKVRLLPNGLYIFNSADEFNERKPFLSLAYVCHHSDIPANLLKQKQRFQLVIAPGTERQQRILVTPEGNVRLIGNRQSRSTPFKLATGSCDSIEILATKTDKCNIYWTVDGKYTGECSPGLACELSLSSLTLVKDLFDALNRLDKAAFELYGQVYGVCALCVRDLKDLTSIRNGIGPDCLKRLEANLMPSVLTA
jgi:hypothetical protein